MKTIARNLGVAMSNLAERLKAPDKPRQPQRRSRDEDGWLLALIRDVTDHRPTCGYRRVTVYLRRQLKELGQPLVNRKRVYRIMHENQRCLQPYGRRPARVHDGRLITFKSKLRWSSDGFQIQCWYGEQVQLAFSLDSHDSEIMSSVSSSRGIDDSLVRDLMAQTVEQQFGHVTKTPHLVRWLTDNHPGYVAQDNVAFSRLLGFEVRTIATYSPESNGMPEAFVKTFKRRYVHLGDPSSGDAVRRSYRRGLRTTTSMRRTRVLA